MNLDEDNSKKEQMDSLISSIRDIIEEDYAAPAKNINDATMNKQDNDNAMNDVITQSAVQQTTQDPNLAPMELGGDDDTDDNKQPDNAPMELGGDDDAADNEQPSSPNTHMTNSPNDEPVELGDEPLFLDSEEEESPLSLLEEQALALKNQTEETVQKPAKQAPKIRVNARPTQNMAASKTASSKKATRSTPLFKKAAQDNWGQDGQVSFAQHAGRVISDDVYNKANSAFKDLNKSVEHHKKENESQHGMLVGNSKVTLETMVKDTLRPILKGWMDEHLSGIVREMVDKEIKRLTTEY